MIVLLSSKHYSREGEGFQMVDVPFHKESCHSLDAYTLDNQSRFMNKEQKIGQKGHNFFAKIKFFAQKGSIGRANLFIGVFSKQSLV